MKSTRCTDLCSATDAELIQLCRYGDQNAYGQIVKRYQSLVCSIVYSRCGDLALSEDLAQDGFILAWQKLGDLKDGGKFKAWICTIVRNLANRSSQSSHRSVTRGAASLDTVADVPSDIESPVERAVSAEEQKLVWEALADVPETYREPLILFYREEQSVARVAEALDLTEDAVKQRLSRGRKMLQQHLASLVESALADSKPAKAFTAAVMLGLSGASAKSAAAAGVATVTATAAKSVASIGAGSGLSSLFLGPILKLPLVAWLLKTALDECRSEKERQLTRRFLLFGLGGFTLFLAALVSSTWWQHHVEPPLLRALLPPAIMVAFLVPWIVLCRRFGKRIERIRTEEGTNTPPRPLVAPDSRDGAARKVYRLFCVSSLLVMAGPAVLPLAARDWLGLSVMLASALCLSVIAARINLRLPQTAFQSYGAGVGLTAIATLCIVFWRQRVWAPTFVDFLPWFIGAISVLTVTQTLLTAVAWKRVYGRPQSPDRPS